jgi:hypothetical protein
VRAARQSMFQFFHHDHTAAAGDNEAITVRIISTGRFFRVSLYLVDSAPMASNSQAISQHSSSPPPAKTMSCLPSWICSTALPIQCAEVAQAELME